MKLMFSRCLINQMEASQLCVEKLITCKISHLQLDGVAELI